ncbi:vesicle transport protein GOT1B isoform X1 [Anolis carolinensis]|uniref:vesicle transport protein GOT1B isoform X1 n=1 Tax=Anolis carolinensis TaxID=28377 RepID=UPI002F2B6C4C
MNKIIEEIRKEEISLKSNPRNKDTQRNIEILQKQREYLIMEERANKLKFIKQDFFQNANKPGRWMSNRIKERKESKYVTKIKEGDKIYTKEEDIKTQFQKFYETLYQKEQIDEEKIMKYIEERKVTKISEKQREELNSEITEQEIKKAIQNLKLNKAPGPDGLTAVYYKTFGQELIPYLKKIMNRIREIAKMPETWKQANICTIHKENSDPEKIKNYRPISLLNLDYKIFSNIIAERFKNFLKNWIKEEQTGFLPNRHQRENVRTIIDLIEYYEIKNQKKVLLLALDAEKAFDNVNWSFFKLLIREIDIGYYFQNTIDAIYTSQKAKILINDRETKDINIEKGTRQGCPLSPLIFILTLEILLNRIREEEELKGAKIQNYEYKIRAFADDIICVIEDPDTKLGKWLEIIREFGAVAGFKINLEKTKAITKNITKKEQETLMEKWNIQIASKIKYLGIIITQKNSQLHENNYLTKWKEMKKEMENWGKLKLSLLGRIACVKMSILPKMIFLFQNLPIIRNQKTLKEWNRDIMKFIWQKKKPRIKLKYMIQEKNRGGLATPDLKLYFEASALMWVRDWTKLKNNKLLNLEGINLRLGWHAYLWYGKSKIEKEFNNHFIRSAILKIWEKYKKKLYDKTPLWVSPLEASQRRLLGWHNWPNYKELLVKQNGEWEMRPQQELREINKKISWYQVWQVKEHFKTDKQVGFEEQNTFWEKITQTDRKIITKIYKKLVEWETEKEEEKSHMTRWNENIGRKIRKEEWEGIWREKLKYSYATDLKENWIKMAYRWHMTPQKLGKCYKNLKKNCWKCEKIEGTYYHMWWGCEKAKIYWKKIRGDIEKILEIKLPMKPEIWLLGITEQKLEKNKDKLLFLLTTAARICYARIWKNSEIPKEEEWLKKIQDIKNMDRLTFLLSKSKGNPIKETNWDNVTKYLEGKIKQSK